MRMRVDGKRGVGMTKTYRTMKLNVLTLYARNPRRNDSTGKKAVLLNGTA